MEWQWKHRIWNSVRIWRAWRHTPTTNSQEYSPVGPAPPLFLNQTEAHPPYVRVWIRHWNRRNFINWARLGGSPVNYALNFYPVMNISPKPVDISCSTSCICFKWPWVQGVPRDFKANLSTVEQTFLYLLYVLFLLYYFLFERCWILKCPLNNFLKIVIRTNLPVRLVMIIELSGVQIGLKSDVWFQNQTSAQREFS